MIDQLAERLIGVARCLLIAFREFLLGEVAEDAEVVVEVDDPLQVVGVVKCRAGGVEFDEALEDGERLRLLAALVQHIGAFKLCLLRENRAGRAPLEPLEQLCRTVVGAVVGFLLRFGVELFQVPAGGFVFRGRPAPCDQCRRADRGQNRSAAPLRPTQHVQTFQTH